MMTMLEKAARTLQIEAAKDENDILLTVGESLVLARAVLMAIKEPDETLSRATQSTEGWEAMIDAILNEKPEGQSDV